MAKKLPPLKVYSFRLDEGAAEALKRRARERGLPVALIIRGIVDDYLNDREGDDYFHAFEERLVATIDRLNRTQLQVRRVADISVAQTEYLRRKIDLLCSKRTPGEDIQEVLAKHRATFMAWLPKALASDGVVRQMIREVMNQQNPIPKPTEQENASGPEGNTRTSAAKPMGQENPLPTAGIQPTSAIDEIRNAHMEPEQGETGPAVPAPKPIGMTTTDVAAPTER